jgi:ribulose-5-phosphate 4-epimerase/fuculose-1-phosphate aldolase
MGGGTVSTPPEFIATCRHLSSRGLSPGSSGNVSVRAGNEILITPTGSSLARVQAEDLVRIDLDGVPVSGGPASKEWPLHVALYRVRQDARAVVHLHAPYSTALACLEPDEEGRAPLPPLTPYSAMRLGPLPVGAYAKPGSSALARGVVELAARSAVMLLANHGSVVAATSLAAAADLSEELETAAMIDFLTSGRARTALTHEQVLELRRE